MQLLVRDRIEHFLDEAAHQHALGLGLRNAAAHQVEHRLFVERAGGRAVPAYHVVGEDFELGLGIDLRLVRQHQSLHHQLGVGLLRVARDDDLALEHRCRAAARNLLEQRLAGAARHRVRHFERDVGVLALGHEVEPGEVAMRALAGEPREQVHAAQRRSRRGSRSCGALRPRRSGIPPSRNWSRPAALRSSRMCVSSAPLPTAT